MALFFPCSTSNFNLINSKHPEICCCQFLCHVENTRVTSEKRYIIIPVLSHRKLFIIKLFLQLTLNPSLVGAAAAASGVAQRGDGRSH